MTRLAEEAKLNKSVVHADVADPHTIASILRIFTHIPQLVAALLNDDVFFKQATNAAFTSVVNREAGKFSVMQMLAAYCDNLLKVQNFQLVNNVKPVSEFAPVLRD